MRRSSVPLVRGGAVTIGAGGELRSERFRAAQHEALCEYCAKEIFGYTDGPEGFWEVMRASRETSDRLFLEAMMIVVAVFVVLTLILLF